VLPGGTDFYRNYCDALWAALNSVEVTDSARRDIPTDDAFTRLVDISRRTQSSGCTQFLCGNGASAAFANHMALDWTKNGKVRALAFSDSALLTAIGNDIGGDEVFSYPLRLYGHKDDILVTISSSGNSPNILQAIDTAEELGLRVITFSGLRPDNRCRGRGELNFFVPAKTYGIVECSHQVLLHAWLDRFMGIAEWECTTYQDMRRSAAQL